jgi:hypothetical protein
VVISQIQEMILEPADNKAMVSEEFFAAGLQMPPACSCGDLAQVLGAASPADTQDNRTTFQVPLGGNELRGYSHEQWLHKKVQIALPTKEDGG